MILLKGELYPSPQILDAALDELPVRVVDEEIHIGLLAREQDLQLPCSDTTELPTDYSLSIYDRDLQYSQPLLLAGFISLDLDMRHLLPELSHQRVHLNMLKTSIRQVLV